MRGFWARIGWSLVALSVFGATPVHGGEADVLISQGVELRKAGRDLEALPLFRKALERQPSPKAFAQLGTCEQAAGLWRDAEIHISEALKSLADPWIQKNASPLRDALARVQAKLGSIEFWGTPEGAKVKIDGQLVGILPTSPVIRASEGNLSLTIEAPGYVSQRRSVDVVPGELIREHVSLQPLGSQLLATKSSVTPPMVDLAPAPSVASSPDSATTDPDASPMYSRWWLWAVLGGVAVGGVSAYFLLRDGRHCQPTTGASCIDF